MRHSRFPLPRIDWKSITGLVIIANLPDVDFLFGWIRGHPNQYHQGATHSLLFITAVSLITGWVYGFVRKGYGVQAGVLVLMILAGHLLCDIMAEDTRPPIGIPLFWPFSNTAVHSPISIFGYVQKSSGSRTFISSLFCFHNGWTILREIGIMGAVFGVLELFRRWSRT